MQSNAFDGLQNNLTKKRDTPSPTNQTSQSSSTNNTFTVNDVLCTCVRNNDIALLTKLIESGTPLDSRDEGGNLAFHWAVLYNNLPMCDILLSHASKQGSLTEANGRSGVVVFNGNIFINNTNSKNESPLHWAVYSGNLDMCKYLFDRGADMNVKDHQNMSIYHIASKNCHVHILQWIYSTASKQYNTSSSVSISITVNDMDVHLKTPLHWAVYANDINSCKWLIGNGANVFIKDNEHCYPLHWAVIKGYGNIILYLCEYLSSLSYNEVMSLRISAQHLNHHATSPDTSSSSLSDVASAGPSPYSDLDEIYAGSILCRFFGSSYPGLSQLTHSDITGSSMLDLNHKQREAEQEAEQENHPNSESNRILTDLNSDLEIIKYYLDKYHASKQLFGIPSILKYGSSTMWSVVLFVWLAVVYIYTEWLYVSFVQRHTMDYTGELLPAFLQFVVFFSLFHLRLAAFGDPGVVKRGNIGDLKYGFISTPLKYELQSVRRAAGEGSRHNPNTSVNEDAEEELDLDEFDDISHSRPDIGVGVGGVSNIQNRLIDCTTYHSLHKSYSRIMQGDVLASPNSTSNTDSVNHVNVCVSCAIEQPLRTHHCPTCNHCVYDLCHHSAILNTCIGGENYRHYVTWLVLALFSLIYVIANYILSVRLAHPHKSLFWSLSYHSSMTLWMFHLVVYVFAIISTLKTDILCVLLNFTRYEGSYCHTLPYLDTDNDGNVSSPFSLSISQNLKYFFNINPRSKSFFSALFTVFLDDCSKQVTLASYDPIMESSWGLSKASYQQLDNEFDDDDESSYSGHGNYDVSRRTHKSAKSNIEMTSFGGDSDPEFV